MDAYTAFVTHDLSALFGFAKPYDEKTTLRTSMLRPATVTSVIVLSTG